MPREKSNSQRKLPACDSCKLRRIRCDPLPPPASCSRCLSKGIVCTTTPIVRKKPKERSGKRIEEAKALYGTSGHGTTSPASSSPYPVIRAESGMVNLQISGELVAHLLQLYTRIPRARLLPCTFLLSTFESANRRLSLLPPVSQALTLAIAATSSRLSSHPVLFGPGPPPPPLSPFFFRPMSIASRATYEFGKRRETACEKLTDMALEHAWKAKVLSSSSEEAMATCFLLQFLEHRRRGHTGTSEHLWKAAFVAHLRERLTRARDAGEDRFLTSHSNTFVFYASVPSPVAWVPHDHGRLPPPDPGSPLSPWIATAPPLLDWSSDPHHVNLRLEDKPDLQEMRLRWCIQLMRDALLCVAQDNICAFTLHDEALICGPPPSSLPELVASASTGDAGAPWWDTQRFLDLVRPFTYHATRIALGNYDWRMRRKAGLPFSFTRLAEHLEDAKHLHTLLAAAQARYVMAYSPEATAMRARSLLPPRPSPWEHSSPSQPSPDLDHSSAASSSSSSSSSRSATSTPERFSAPEPDYQDTQFGRLTGRHLLSGMRNALGSVHIPVFEDLQARVGAAGECGADCGSAARARADAGAGIEGGGMEPGCSNPSPNQEVEVETLKPILATLRRALTPWCQLMLRTALAGPHLGWLTHLGNEPFSFWCRFLLRVVPIEDGGDVVTREEKLAALETMSELMVVVSWSWSASFELPIRQEILKTVEEIKLAIALDRERLLAAASASESGSAGLYTTPPSNLSSSPGTSASAGRSNYGGQGDGEGDTQRQNRRRRFEGQYVLPAALELPNVEAIMREAGVMDIVEGASGLARVCYAPLRDSGGRVGGVISGKESVYVPLLDGGVEGGSGALYPSADATTGASISTQSMHVQATMPEPTYEQSLWSDEYSFVPLDGAAFVSAPGMQTVVQEDAGFPQSQEHGQLDGGVSGQGWDELGMDQDFWATLGAGNDGAGDVYGSGEGTAGYYRGV